MIAWLLEGDPALRWQVLQDLTAASAAEVLTERQRVAEVGWGSQLLAAQEAAGTWAQGLYLPKWTSTTYTLLLLRWLGLAAAQPQAITACRCLWDGATYSDGGQNLGYRSPETYVTGMLVLLGSHFRYRDSRIEGAVSWLLRDQLPDGGWNCRASGAARDPQLSDAVARIRSARGPDGTWKRYPPYPGKQWFTLEPPGPSRIATLRCLRVLAWWDHGCPAG